MNAGTLLQDVQQLVGTATETLRLAGAIQAEIARAMIAGTQERLWRPAFAA